MTRLPFGNVRQLGHVVEDVGRSVAVFSRQLGIGPWTIIRNIPLQCVFRGKPSTPVIDIALSYRGDVQIELIQQKDTSPSPYRACIEAGRYGLHHTAYLCEHIDADVKEAEARGLQVACDIRMNAGRYVYLQSPELGEHMYVELLETTPTMKQMFEYGIPAAAAWDGGGEPVVIDFASMSAGSGS